ncbi:MAG: acylphosphatase, partial [Thermoplasmata archaeon]|nr:acylphosphatase [Thermoplasmata archaeon]
MRRKEGNGVRDRGSSTGRGSPSRGRKAAYPPSWHRRSPSRLLYTGGTRVQTGMRVRLLIKGTVQGVGFRALVKQLGRNLGLKGTIRNLSDGSVEVYCEGAERLIGDFRKKLEYRGDPDSPFSLNVESITLYPEGDAEYASPPENWEPIDVDYGEALSTFEREMLERAEIGSLLLVETNSETRRVGEKVDSV